MQKITIPNGHFQAGTVESPKTISMITIRNNELYFRCSENEGEESIKKKFQEAIKLSEKTPIHRIVVEANRWIDLPRDCINFLASTYGQLYANGVAFLLFYVNNDPMELLIEMPYILNVRGLHVGFFTDIKQGRNWIKETESNS